MSSAFHYSIPKPSCFRTLFFSFFSRTRPRRAGPNKTCLWVAELECWDNTHACEGVMTPHCASHTLTVATFPVVHQPYILFFVSSHPFALHLAPASPAHVHRFRALGFVGMPVHSFFSLQSTCSSWASPRRSTSPSFYIPTLLLRKNSCS